ncbi:MAG: topoisomerase DNA-binding C4 zinc finger domain-containing protein [Candidatus Thiodiazotropha taylori]
MVRQASESKSQVYSQIAGDVCPTCKAGTLVLRTLKNGKNSGKKFYGCTKYPMCQHFSWAKT